MISRTLLLLVVLSVAPLSSATSATLEPVIEKHVVEAGDTLARLARRYLGADAPWNINLQFNQHLANPNQLAPGQIVNIVTGYAPPEPEPTPIVVEEVATYQAVIEKVANEVEKNLKQTDWRNASQGDELFPLDAVRTLSNSSALLRFDGTSEILVSEYSQIFLRALEVEETGTSRSEIEVRRGETQLRLADSDSPEQRIEINVAGVITRPERGRDGTNATRARLAAGKTSQIMVYAGESAVESAGVSVAVEQGMGTVAVAGRAPATPERLLPAPEIVPIDADLRAPEHLFRWQPVVDAALYRVELCLDRRCEQPLRTVRDIATTTVKVDSLPVGQAFWRVTAVSASGLDGFTSITDQFAVIDPPTVPSRSAVPVFIGIMTVMLLALFFMRNETDPHDEETILAVR